MFDRITLWDFSKPIRERHEGPCDPYYFTPGPMRTGRERSETRGGYLNRREDRIDEGAGFMLRTAWADKVEGAHIDHRGWYTDEECEGYGELIRGIVARLPNGRGFLAGWSYGAQMTAVVGIDTVYDTEKEAARAADGMAECAAEDERDHAREQRESDEREERESEERAILEDNWGRVVNATGL